VNASPKPAPPAGHSLPLPWVRLRSASSGPQIFKRMLGDVDPAAKPGDVVAVYDKSDAPYGAALYNPKSLIALRLLTRGLAGFDTERYFAERLAAAVRLRRDVLGLDKTTDAYRVVFDNGDGLPGLVVDRYGDIVVLEFYSLAMFKQAARLERLLKEHFPSARFTRRASEHVQSMEGFRLTPRDAGVGGVVRVSENGVLFEVDTTGGRKTGFFCDQRDNRLELSKFCAGKRVMDVCGYTGGFALYAKKVGKAADVVTVELDPDATAQAKRNANINQVQIRTVTVDAFPHLRQANLNGEVYDVVILDPYKLIASQEGYALGRQKYIDLNRLGMSLLRSGGLLLTCSCSGLLPWDQFQQFVRTAAGSAGRRLQILKKSGAGPDHPFAVDFPEGEYLKALWCRVL